MPEPSWWLQILGSHGGAALVWGSAVAAAVFIAVRFLVLWIKGVSLRDRLGAVGWSFGESWASTITAVGALLGTVLSAQVLGDGAQPLSNTAMTGLNLLFGALVLIAPLIFAAFSVAAPGDANDSSKGPSYQGFVGPFFLSAFVTLWAVVGELGTLIILLSELEGTVSGWLSRLFIGIALAGIFLIGLYAWRTIEAVVLYKAQGVRTYQDKTVQRSAAKRWTLL